MTEPSKKRVLITGANGAIGASIANRFSEHDWLVAAVDTAFTNLSTDENIAEFKCNLTDNDVDTELSAIEHEFGLPDMLLNCVGLIHNEPVTSFEKGRQHIHATNTWNAVLASNLSAPFFVARYFAARCLRKQIPLVIVNISSISAKGRVGQSAYSAAKAGLESLTRTMGLELGRTGIRSNSIALGFFETTTMRANMSEESLARTQDEVAIGRFGYVDEIFDTVLFCFGNSYINGTTLHLDGGM